MHILGHFQYLRTGWCWGVYFIVDKPRVETPRSQEAEQRYFVCSAPCHFDARGRILPHMPLIIINLYNNEYNINILFMYIYYYIMCAYYVANVATFEIVLLMQCRKREI